MSSSDIELVNSLQKLEFFKRNLKLSTVDSTQIFDSLLLFFFKLDQNFINDKMFQRRFRTRSEFDFFVFRNIDGSFFDFLNVFDSVNR